ncbi:hypothetical protein V6N13_074040 [Hibiscus sabdariffa]
MNEQSKSTLQVFDEMLERKGVREESRTTDLLIQSDVQHEADAAMIQGLKGQSMCTTQMFDVINMLQNKENMTDEMLAEFKGALSTDMDLVHLLGISTSAYSIRLALPILASQYHSELKTISSS